MKAIIAGHEYELRNADENRIIGTLFFVHKEMKNGKIAMVKDGTSTEEVIRVLIDRIEHLDSIVKAKENKVVITALKKALQVLEERTADRKTRAVEGTAEL